MKSDLNQSHLEALETIKKKLQGKSLHYREIYNLMDEIAHERLGDVLTAYFVASGFKDGFSPDELYYLTKSMVETGTKLHFDGIVADKHSIGGLPGTRATMIIVPIVAAAGFTMPKTSSRAITSPAGTADVMETLAKVEFTPEQINRIIAKTKGCIVWNGRLGLAPADDIIIQVEEPLSFESFDKIIVSVLAKKVAVGANRLVIDIPVGRTMKVQHEADAEKIAKKFKDLAHRFGITMHADINHATQPAGNGIGPRLEARDVLYVLEQDKKRPMELENRSLRLAAQVLNLCYGLAVDNTKGMDTAVELLRSGRALTKFKDIVAAQMGDPDIDSSRIRLLGHTVEFRSDRSGTIKSINNYHLSAVCKILGAPKDQHAGIMLIRRKGDIVVSGEVLMTLHAHHEHPLREALETLQHFPIMDIQ